MEELKDKDSLLRRLKLFSTVSDDDNVNFKQKIYNTFLNCPELLYAIHENDLEQFLFNEDGTINYDGEWYKYFSEYSRDGNIRPYLFIPQSQIEVHNYVCYQTHFEEVPRYNAVEKYALITFNIMIHGEDVIDNLTSIPRHDLIGAIIKDKINWSNIFGLQCHVVSDKESMTDNNYIVRTIIFRSTNLNNIVQTTYNGNGSKISTNTINNLGRK